MKIWLDGAEDLWRDEQGGMWATEAFDAKNRPTKIIRLSDRIVRPIELAGDPVRGVHSVSLPKAGGK